MAYIKKKQEKYIVKEVFNQKGQDIKDVLKNAFKVYCVSILQK